MLIFLALLISQSPPMETMGYSADSLDYLVTPGVLKLFGEASLSYLDMTLKADTINYDPDRETLTATGEPSITESGETAGGTEMIYHIPSRTARTSEARTWYDGALYTGERVTMLSRREFNAENARFTTSERDTLDWWFWAASMKVFPDDKAIARPIVLYVENTPVFWFPYAVFPIRRGRSSGFMLPTLGQSGRDGKYLRRLGYYFGFSDYVDLQIRSDIMEKTRFSLSLQERHRLRYVHDGGFRVEWRREYENSRDRWMVNLAHMHELRDGTMLKLQGSFLSDRSYLEDTQGDPQERMNREARSYFSLTRRLWRGSLQAAADATRYLDTDPDTLENQLKDMVSMPDIRYSLPSSPIFPGRDVLDQFYWNASLHYTAEREIREIDDRYDAGLKMTSELTFSQRFLGVLAFSPRARFTGAVYDRSLNGDAFPAWLHGSVSTTVGTDLYGVFGQGLGYNSLRHTVSPSITWSWAPDSYIDGNGVSRPVDHADSVYPVFSDFNLPSGGNLYSLSLLNRLEGKRTSRSGVERASLATLSLSSTYNPEPLSGEESFSNISAGLEITPVQSASIRADGSWDPYAGRMDNLTLTTSLRLAGYDPSFAPDSLENTDMPWRLNLSHTWSPVLSGEGGDLNKIRVSGSVDVTPNWSISYQGYYDFDKNDFLSQSYTITRDLETWEALFTRHVSDIDTGFYFRINVKVFPDIKVEQHASSF